MGKVAEFWKKFWEGDVELNMKIDRVLIPLMFLGCAGSVIYFGI